MEQQNAPQNPRGEVGDPDNANIAQEVPQQNTQPVAAQQQVPIAQQGVQPQQQPIQQQQPVQQQPIQQQPVFQQAVPQLQQQAAMPQQFQQQQFQYQGFPQGAYQYYQPQPYGASVASMPARNSGSAPKFDSKNPRDLLRYFSEVELLLNAANINDDQAKKDHTKRYLSTQDFEIWDSLPESGPRFTYMAFKEAVVASYPGAEADRKYSRSDLSRLTETRRNTGIASTTELGEYYRDFRTMSAYLIAREKISEMEARREFVAGFPRDLLVRVAHKLQVTYPERDPDDGYPIGEVYRAAVFILRGSSFFPQDMYSAETSLMTPMPPAHAPAPSNARSSTTPVTTTETTPIKQEDRLFAALDRFAQTIASVTASVNGGRPPALAQTSAPQTSQSVPGAGANMMPRRAFLGENDRCNFCGETGHYIANCPTAEQYLREGKALRRPDGRLGLPNGYFVPRSIEGQWLKDRLDEWWRRQLGAAADRPPAPSTSQQNTGSSMFYSLGPASKSQPVLNEVSASPVATMMHQKEEEDVEAKIWSLQQEIYALQTRSGKKRHVEVLKRPAAAPRGQASKPAEERTVQPTATNESRSTERAQQPQQERLSARATEKQPSRTNAAPGPSSSSSQPAAAPTSSNAPAEPPVHPYEKAKNAHYVPPVDRNFGAASKPKDKDATYHTVAPIQNPQFIDKVLDRSLRDTRITLSLEELLSLSPDLRYRVKDKVTSRRLPAANKTQANYTSTGSEIVEEIMSYAVLEDYDEDAVEVEPGVYRVPDIAQTFYSAPDLRQKVTLKSAKESHSLRAIHMELAGKAKVECILDPGSMIVAMSDAVSHQLGIPYDPEIKLQMQSANGEFDATLGLARDVPFRFEDITLLIQCHVVQSPAYDILMGRPFDVLTRSIVRNYENAEQTITITDPNSGRVYTIPTVERGPPRFQLMRVEKDFQQASRN